jgi:hypothetical protein
VHNSRIISCSENPSGISRQQMHIVRVEVKIEVAPLGLGMDTEVRRMAGNPAGRAGCALPLDRSEPESPGTADTLEGPSDDGAAAYKTGDLN